jgi:hypothetical protein
MKVTQDGKTLFQALSAMFFNKVGHAISKRSFGKNTTLVAVRNKEGGIETITLLLRKNRILEVKALDNHVFLDTTSWFTKLTMNRLNKALSMIGLNISQRDGDWMITDARGQAAQFKNAESINLSRPHGSAIYEQV